MKILLFVTGILFSFFSCADEKFNQLLKAAEQGDSESQHSVALGYFVAKNNELAVYWYRRAVMQGNESSLYNLGALYCAGYGVELNIEACYALVSLAAAKASGPDRIGFNFAERAKNKVEDVFRRMTEPQILAAKALVTEMSKPNNLLVALDVHVEKAKEETADNQ